MMLRNVLCIFCAGIILIGINTGAMAQDVSQVQDDWDPPSAGPVTTWTAPLCGKGKFVIQPFVFYNRTRGSFDEDGHYGSLTEGEAKSQYQQQLFMQYGLTDTLEIDGQAVYQENFIKSAEGKARDNGFGDSYLFLRYCAFEEKGLRPQITALAQLKMPTGKYQHLDSNKLGTDSMGAGSWDPGAGLIMTKKFKPFIFHADAAYSFPQRTLIDGFAVRYANYLNYDFGLEYFLPRGFSIVLEANGFLQGDKKEGSDKLPSSGVSYISVSPGFGWSCQKAQFLLAYQRVVAGVNTDANDSIVLTAVYAF
ncbi:MAG: transporter [Candidatus Omnitrophica bacterium]|nr:transporter [Candidatus Omnitrophota bacterium]